MRLSDIMSIDVVTVSPKKPIAEALEEMRRKNLHHLVVIDGGHVVGVVSARDIGTGNGDRTVREVMHPHVVTAKGTTTVREAANLLRGHTIGCLPVFEGDRLAGIVTITDLLELIGRGVEKPIERSTKWIEGRRPARAPKRT